MILKVLCCLRVPFLWQASKEILEATTLRSILSKDLGDSELDVTEDWDFHLSSARGDLSLDIWLGPKGGAANYNDQTAEVTEKNGSFWDSHGGNFSVVSKILGCWTLANGQHPKFSLKYSFLGWENGATSLSAEMSQILSMLTGCNSAWADAKETCLRKYVDVVHPCWVFFGLEEPQNDKQPRTIFKMKQP